MIVIWAKNTHRIHRVASLRQLYEDSVTTNLSDCEEARPNDKRDPASAKVPHDEPANELSCKDVQHDEREERLARLEQSHVLHRLPQLPEVFYDGQLQGRRHYLTLFNVYITKLCCVVWCCIM